MRVASFDPSFALASRDITRVRRCITRHYKGVGLLVTISGTPDSGIRRGGGLRPEPYLRSVATLSDPPPQEGKNQAVARYLLRPRFT